MHGETIPFSYRGLEEVEGLEGLGLPWASDGPASQSAFLPSMAALLDRTTMMASSRQGPVCASTAHNWFSFARRRRPDENELPGIPRDTSRY